MPEDQPQVTFPKNIFSSKTLWANLLGPVFVYLGTKYGLDLTPEQQAQVIAIVMGGVNVLLRLVTNGPATFDSPMRARQTVSPASTMIFSPHLDQPMALNPGTYEVTVPTPPVPVPVVPKVTIKTLSTPAS